jgi:hypothetical protein
MVSLIVHAMLSLVVIWFAVASNSHIFSRPLDGPRFSVLEVVYYVVGIASIVVGYSFNTQFVAEYATASSNPIWGPGSWQEFIQLGYVNPAAASVSQDYTIINVILLPLFTIVDGAASAVRGSSSCRVCLPAVPSRTPSTSPLSNASAGTSRGGAGLHRRSLTRA